MSRKEKVECKKITLPQSLLFSSVLHQQIYKPTTNSHLFFSFQHSHSISLVRLFKSIFFFVNNHTESEVMWSGGSEEEEYSKKTSEIFIPKNVDNDNIYKISVWCLLFERIYEIIDIFLLFLLVSIFLLGCRVSHRTYRQHIYKRDHTN